MVLVPWASSNTQMKGVKQTPSVSEQDRICTFHNVETHARTPHLTADTHTHTDTDSRTTAFEHTLTDTDSLTSHTEVSDWYFRKRLLQLQPFIPFSHWQQGYNTTPSLILVCSAGISCHLQAAKYCNILQLGPFIRALCLHHFLFHDIIIYMCCVLCICQLQMGLCRL